jgi:hypothetical protein
MRHDIPDELSDYKKIWIWKETVTIPITSSREIHKNGDNPEPG